MSQLSRIALASMLCLVAGSAVAADRRIEQSADPTRAARVAEARAAHALLMNRVDPAATVSVPPGAGIKSGIPIANSLRTYPPSCLADPLPTAATGPIFRNSNVELAAVDGQGNFQREIVTITIWRVACSSAQTFNSATLMRIQRDAQFEGDTDVYPLFPAINVAQGSTGFDTPNLSLIRAASEPNTIIADTPVDSPIVFSTTYVLENYPYVGAGVFDFNLPFSIRFDNQFASNRFFTISNVPLYSPTAGTYPEAFLNLPISGYLSTNWYDPANDGEGLVIQIYESESDPNNLEFAFSWSTYDNDGIPYWFFGQATVARGARLITSPMAYRTGGGFAGTGGVVSPPQIWGTTTFAFPDCNSLSLSFAANPGLPAGVPTGSGTRQWIRVANVNGLFCE